MDLEYVSELVQALLLAIVPVLAAQVAAYLFQAYKVKRAELTERQRWMLDQAIPVAIFAAEQLFKAGDGAQKKQYALDYLQSWVAKSGLKIDAHELSARIEAEVYNQFKRDFPPELPE
jgi:hypothetical protein